MGEMFAKAEGARVFASSRTLASRVSLLQVRPLLGVCCELPSRIRARDRRAFARAAAVCSFPRRGAVG